MNMPQMKESAFWASVKVALADQHTHLSRIENTAGSGISDVSACYRGKEVWIELKMFHGNSLHFRTTQRLWILRRTDVGGTVMLLARDGDTLYLYNAREVMQAKSFPVGKDGKAFQVKRQDLPQVLYWCNKPFAWKEVHAKLFNT